MRRASSVFIAAALLLSACGGNDVAEPQVSQGTVASEAGTVPSPKKAVIPPGFPRTIGVQGEVLTALLSSSFSAVDPTVRSLLTKAREPFHLALTDGVHLFSPRLKSMGLLRAEIRRDLVTAADVMGGEASEMIAVLEYKGSDTVLASEVLVFSVESGSVTHAASYVLGSAVPTRVAVANGAIRVRAEMGGRVTDMTFTPER